MYEIVKVVVTLKDGTHKTWFGRGAVRHVKTGITNKGAPDTPVQFITMTFTPEE